MKNKNGRMTKIIKFCEERGFYIVLFLCVVSIGISGYVYLFAGGESTTDNDEQIHLDNIEKIIPEIVNEFSNNAIAENNQSISEDKNEEQNTDRADAVKTEPEETENTTDKAKGSAQSGEGSKVNGSADTNSVKVANDIEVDVEEDPVVRPVLGNVVHGFSGEDMEYSETMEDWRVHAGTDFEVQYGEQVKAIMKGTVEDIYCDEVYGWCVLIDHGDEVKTLYTGLMEPVTIEVGDNVFAGSVIGGFGDTAIYEAAEETRLHVEMIDNGVRVNLETILPVK